VSPYRFRSPSVTIISTSYRTLYGIYYDRVVYSGTGDPARSLALLWRGRQRPGRSGLSVDRIVAAAIEVADADGLPALSMRRVAEKLGVGTMSLYTHVPGKAELVDLMLDKAYGETLSRTGELSGKTAPPEESAGAWRAKLEHVARENWALYHRHPWLLQVTTVRPVLGPNVTAKYEHELRAIDGIGLTDLEMDLVLNLVAGHVEGSARRSLESAQAEQLTGVSDEQWWRARAPILGNLVDYSQYPIASRVGSAAGKAYNSPYNAKEAFEFGLQRVLDGIEALIRTRTAG
jgi:AcrR family transcriptional regulator